MKHVTFRLARSLSNSNPVEHETSGISFGKIIIKHWHCRTWNTCNFVWRDHYQTLSLSKTNHVELRLFYILHTCFDILYYISLLQRIWYHYLFPNRQRHISYITKSRRCRCYSICSLTRHKTRILWWKGHTGQYPLITCCFCTVTQMCLICPRDAVLDDIASFDACFILE